MGAYESFAEVYDLFMDDVPYDKWASYITEILSEYGIKDGIVLELGCGTGKMTRILSDVGYDMIGVDSSEEMLGIARTAEEENGNNILYLLQDMREFELYGTVRAVISVCDSMNYILEEAELSCVFSLVNNYLDPGGIFLFDLNTLYKYEELLGESTIAENRPKGSFIWENYFDKESGINEYELTLFVHEQDNLYRKYEEMHYQKAYGLETVKHLLEKAGLNWIAAYDAYTKTPVERDSERICILAQKNTD